MRFVWDQDKNRLNLAKHKIGFETASLVFQDRPLSAASNVSSTGRNAGRRWV